MNLYLVVFFVAAALMLAERIRPQWEEWIYWCCWGLMAAVLCLRFGQGTDYVTMHGIYETIPTVIDWSQGYFCGRYPELGWRLLSAAFKVCGASFPVFTMALGLADMLLVHRFLRKYVARRTAGLFLLYPVLYLVYMVSGLRQGLATCIFLGLSLPFYLEKKWVRYILSVLLAASFHKVGYAWLVLVPVYYLSMKRMLMFVGLAVGGGLVLQLGPVQKLLASLLPVYHVQQFLLEGSPSIFAVGERLSSFCVLFALYVWISREYGEDDERTGLLMKAYLCGVGIYMLLCGSAYYASRYGAIFKVLECALVTAFTVHEDWAARAGAAFFFGLALLMGVKNMNAMVVESGFDKFGVQVFDYPYISVLHPEAIEQYFSYEEKLAEKYENNIEDQELWRIER